MSSPTSPTSPSVPSSPTSPDQGENGEDGESGETGEETGITAALEFFNFTSDGWQRDPDGVTVLRIAGDARVTIPYQIFAEDFRTTGKTIEVEFATRDVMDYDAVILSCMSGGRGLRITAQSCSLSSEQTSISMQYKEDEHVRVGFVIEKRTENRLVYCYINGIMSGVVQYPDGDDFSQMDPVGISIGSSGCTTDIYCIRIYDNDLSRAQMLDNWIADTQDGGKLLERYSHNNVYDEYGNIVISKLPSDLPYLILECAELPQYKGDKKTVSGSYTDPVHPAKSFTFTGCEANVQGTSSQYYERKNYTLKFKGGFTDPSGVTTSTYKMTDTSVPAKEFCMKADVASSEGANNVELARLYNEACVYRTPAQVRNANTRQAIDGHPIVIFWRNTTDNTTTFLGKANFNDSKGSEDVFGFQTGDESWEVCNNTSDRVLWKSADFSSDDWQNDFEARYPDMDPPYTDHTQLKSFADWIVSTDTTAATGEALAVPVSYDGVTYALDTAAYRLAKFRAEIGDYVEIDSALFYYLFTELFLMVDSRAKNMFPSFMGSSVVLDITARLAPSPTEADGVANNQAVQAVTLSGDTITVAVDLDDLVSFASSDPAQGSGKWLALEIGTGQASITDVQYNGYTLTGQDVADAEATGCSAGSFVLYIKAESVAASPKTFTLTADGYSPRQITIEVVERSGM